MALLLQPVMAEQTSTTASNQLTVSLNVAPTMVGQQHELPATAIFTNQLTLNRVTSEIANGPASSWKFGVSLWLASDYYGTIFGGIFYNGPMSFWDVFGSCSNALGTATIDLSLGQKLDHLDTYNVDGGNEYDLTIDQTFKIGPFLGDAGICYLALFDLRNMKDDVFEEFVQIDLPIKSKSGKVIVQPYYKIFHYHVMGNGMEDKGWFMYMGVVRNQKLGFDILSKPAVLNIDYRCGASAGAFDSSPGIEYHRLALTLPIQLSKHLVVSPSVIGQTTGDGGQTYVRHCDAFYSLTLKWLF